MIVVKCLEQYIEHSKDLINVNGDIVHPLFCRLSL